jgi:hypothetical protein
VPDLYAPGYLAALKRIIGLDFQIFVLSNFGCGVKQDLIDRRDMMEESRRLTREAISTYGVLGAGDN